MDRPHAYPPAVRAFSGQSLVQRGFDASVPNVARIYDALIGGKDNYSADRQIAAKLLAAVPGAAVAARENRAFLARAVRYLARDAGISQFLDIGTGLPTGGNVHEIVHAVRPQSHVVYADYDPVVVLHVDALLAKAPTVAAVQADLRTPHHLLTLPSVRALIDLAEPVAVLLVAVLHFVEDCEDPWAIVKYLKDQMAPGSYLVVSHATADHIPAGAAVRARQAYEGASAPGVPRTRQEIARFFEGLEIVEPGLVAVSDWRPAHIAPPTRPILCYAGIGRKNGRGRP